MGTGPFQFVSRVPGESLEYKRYPAYWRPGPHLDGIKITLLDDSRTATNALVSGQQDFIMQLDVADKARVDSSDSARVVVGPSLAVARCTFRFEKGPFSDVRVREAVNYGIDRDAINKVNTQGLGEPANAAVPSSHWAYPGAAAQVYTHDVAKAKQLVTEAGYPNGLTVEDAAVPDDGRRAARGDPQGAGRRGGLHPRAGPEPSSPRPCRTTSTSASTRCSCRPGRGGRPGHDLHAAVSGKGYYNAGHVDTPELNAAVERANSATRVIPERQPAAPRTAKIVSDRALYRAPGVPPVHRSEHHQGRLIPTRTCSASRRISPGCGSAGEPLPDPLLRSR